MSDLLTLVGALSLIAFSGTFVILCGVELLRPESYLNSTSWRDPAPLLFRMMMPLAQRYGRNINLADDKASVIQQRLARAGLAFSVLPRELVVFCYLFAIVSGLLACYALILVDLSWFRGISLIVAMSGLGYIYPYLWLRDAAKKREHQFQKEFPFLLELLGLSMRAGLTFSAALQNACDHLPNGPVQQEFGRVMRDVRTGKSRRDSLSRLAERVDMPSVSNFVASIIQAEETGGSLADVLAEQARQRRQERFARAEKQANEAPVKMLAPLVLLLFPVTFIIIAFPIVLEFLEAGASGFLA